MKRLEALSRKQAMYEDAAEKCHAVAEICSVELEEELPEGMTPGMPVISDEKIYLHESTEGHFIPLNEEPNRMAPPFPFVSTLYVQQEVLYESTAYYQAEQNLFSAENLETETTEKGAAEE